MRRLVCRLFGHRFVDREFRGSAMFMHQRVEQVGNVDMQWCYRCRRLV